MEKTTIDKVIEASYAPRVAGAIALIMLAAFLLIASLKELREYQYVGAGVAATNTISVDGTGDAYAVPDTATFSYTVDETGADVATAQQKATAKANDVLSYIKGQGIDDKDIQTTDYEINPQYQYSSQICSTAGYCPPQKQTISGYEVADTVTVKVRDASKAGALLAGVGSRNVSNVSGLTFQVADEDAVESQARDLAIKDAQAKTKQLASQLGVSLVRIVGFSENGSSPVVPMYARAQGAMDAAASVAPAPQIPTGQDKVTSNVSISYEIR